jgi:hypothetical protein
MNPPPPPPDTKVRFSRVGEEEIECLYSPQHEYRAVISRDRAGLYRVCRERWNTSDWELARHAFWSEDERTVTITDTVENARTLAMEHLSEVTDTVPVAADGSASRTAAEPER